MLKLLAITRMRICKLPTHPVILESLTACAAIAMTIAFRMGSVSRQRSMFLAEGFAGPLLVTV